MSLVEVDELSVAFGEKRVVDRVSFTLDRGETLALVGESGSGKSVTALSILQLLPYPYARHPRGSIRLKGEELVGVDRKRLQRLRGNKVSMIFQEPMTSLNPLHTIQSQIGEILQLHNPVSAEMARARTLELLSQVGIPDPETRLASYPHQLSGGQRQRVNVARALMNEPTVLLVDEPTSALDHERGTAVVELISRLTRERATATVLVTHDRTHLAGADHVVEIRDGGM